LAELFKNVETCTLSAFLGLDLKDSIPTNEPGYKVARSDRRNGRRSGGVAVYIKDQYKYKILSKSPGSCIIDYIFIELKFHGEDILIGLVYNPPGVPGLPVYHPILEDLFPRYSHGNTNLLVNSVHALELNQVFESVPCSTYTQQVNLTRLKWSQKSRCQK
jgi:hypothetical protein